MNNVIVRMILYVLSPLIAAGVQIIPGWGVTYDSATQVLSISLPSLIGATVLALGLSGAVFARWGGR